MKIPISTFFTPKSGQYKNLLTPKVKNCGFLVGCVLLLIMVNHFSHFSMSTTANPSSECSSTTTVAGPSSTSFLNAASELPTN